MMNGKISIIVPVYNVEKYLKQCLDSLIHQTYRNVEIICVNDGSTDHSLDILKSYAYDDRIKIVEKTNGGLSDARNAGLKHVTGEYIMFVDSDDWIDVETCEKSIEKMIQNDVDVVMWSYTREYGDKSLKKFIFDKDIYFDEEDTKYKIYRRLFGLYGEELAHPENADAIVTAWGKLYKSDLILKNNIEFVDTKKIGTEDALFNIQAFNYVKKCYYLNYYFNHYRKTNDLSLTSMYKKELFERWKTLFMLMDKHIQSNKLDSSFRKALANRIALSMIGLGLNIVCSSLSFFKKGKELKLILDDNIMKSSLSSLELKYFQIHWKVYFYCLKKRFVILAIIMLKIMNMLRSKS